MRFTDWRLLCGAAGLSLLGGCSEPPAPAGGAAHPARTGLASEESRHDASRTPPAPMVKGDAEPVRLPPPGPVRSWDELKRQAAHRIVAANPDGTYMGTVPEALLAIPVLEIELKRDGSIAHVRVLRAPRQAKDTTELAIAAVHRAAPFGDVSRLSRPWRFTETFLFDDDRKFKPRSLDN